MNRPRNQAEHELKARARIYVANIPQPGMTRKEVVSVFHKYGEIESMLSVYTLIYKNVVCVITLIFLCISGRLIIPTV